MRCGVEGEWEQVELAEGGMVRCALVIGLDHELAYFFRVRAHFRSGFFGVWWRPALGLAGKYDGGIRSFRVVGDAIAVAGETGAYGSDKIRVVEGGLEEDDGSVSTYFYAHRNGAELMQNGTFEELDDPDVDKVVWERITL